MKFGFKATRNACFTGYIVQAIVNNFVPLLFLTFQRSYGIPLSKIAFLITFNFGLQLVIDLISAGIVDRIGYRVSVVAAHLFVTAGLILLTILPGRFEDPFIGLVIAVIVYSVGGGLIEVLISPIIEACPNDNKEAAMSLLHSFYCWGLVGVVLISTLFFTFVGLEHWKLLSVLWAMVPLVNAIFFLKVPIANLLEEGESGMTIRELAGNGTFWIMMLLMLCAGAAENSVGQWASALAERGLGVSKTIGDLLGPMLFAAMMGVARTLYSRKSEQLNLQKSILVSSILCIVSYLLISLSPGAVMGFIGCALCGFSVGILWPGTFSMSAAEIRRGGTALFAMLALAGDLGCTFGPTLVGTIAGTTGERMKQGILAAIIFPVLLVGCMLINQMRLKKVEG